jgi:tRNA-modifying protein YgfZ
MTPTLPPPAESLAPARPVGAAEGAARLLHLGVIRAVGEDAASFLQGQLTQDVLALGPHEARLAAFCNAKGRMQASFVVWKSGAQEVLLVCSRDLLAQTLKRLSMFVLRAKVKLLDASADFELFGLAGSGSENWQGPSGSAIDSIAANARIHWATADFEGGKLVFLHPGDGVSRALWCAPAGTPAPDLPVLAAGWWEWLEVRAGIAPVTLPIFEAFVPQMLNYESVGGVSFKKGCYPGQEVVARSQFRGTLKRRAYLVHAYSALAVGSEVFHTGDPTQPCGMVAASAANPAGGFDAIVSMQTAAAGAGSGLLTAGGPQGAALALLPLPYPLLDDL